MKKEFVSDLLKMQEEQEALKDFRKAFDRTVKVIFGLSSVEIRKMINSSISVSSTPDPEPLSYPELDHDDTAGGIDAYKSTSISDYI